MTTTELSLSKAVGFEYESLPVSWNQRDLLLYAVSIGVKANELNLNYEKHPQWSPFPTYPIVLNLKGDSNSINDFSAMKDKGGKPPLPHFDANRVVHAEQTVQVIKAIPADSGKGWSIKRRINGIKDTGKGLIIETEMTLVSPSNEVYNRMFSSAFYVGTSFEKGFNKFLVEKPVGEAPPKDRKPDYVHTDVISEEKATLYRLNADYNPLHIDPALGKSMGFGGVILHGLCSYGHAAHAILAGFANSDPSLFVSMTGRFASPVLPGQTLETLGWKEEKGESIEVTFVQRIKETGKINISHGKVVLKRSPSSKL